jgi:peptidoglycan hydrolase-like protein with peptidoglycan-binding domain
MLAFFVLPALSLEAGQQAGGLTMASINEAEWQDQVQPSTSLLVKLQVLLDRAHTSPGVIDGTPGENTRKAIAAFSEMKGLDPTEQVNEDLWRALVEADSEAALVTYKITEKDARGPFSKNIPEDFRKKAAMDRLGYTSPEELLAEKFHMSEDLLRKLNPGASFDKPGQEIVVANVEHKSVPGKISRVEVDAKRQFLKAYGGDDKLIAIYPVTVGSEDRPSPKGEFEVTKIIDDPVYQYDPALDLRGVHAKEKLKIPPGPNNPVGAVWIDLSAEGYGIHGTPDPDKVSKAASHGCIRLTNWDALELARHLSKRAPVAIHDGEKAGGNIQQKGSLLAAADATPIPERNPARSHSANEQTPPSPGEVVTIPWSEIEIAAAKAKCTEMLSSVSLDYEPLPPIKEGLCGAPAPILLKSVGSTPKVVIDPPATVTCMLAKALSDWLTQVVQPEAKSMFDSAVTKLHASSYACRNRNGALNQGLSEHALANAIDISDFVLDSGEQVTVARSWHDGAPPPPMPKPGRLSGETFPTVKLASLTRDENERRLLKSIQEAACARFGTVLGPGADEAHKSHLHLDMKQRRGAGFCP